MRIEWNKKKAEANLRKHGVDFADAAVALEDENALTLEDTGFEERRFKTLALGPVSKSYWWCTQNVMNLRYELFQQEKPTAVRPGSITED